MDTAHTHPTRGPKAIFGGQFHPTISSQSLRRYWGRNSAVGSLRRLPFGPATARIQSLQNEGLSEHGGYESEIKFTLHYRGTLNSNGGPKEKQNLRRCFLPQLKDLWGRRPLVAQKDQFLDPCYELTAVKRIDGWNFASVVNEKNHLIAKLDIVFLRPEEPGAVITQGGDIDNRLKTLFDALSIPQAGQILRGDSPDESEDPFHCLLEDDNLITGVNITVDRLLGPTSGSREVLLLIGVDISCTRGTFANLEISL